MNAPLRELVLGRAQGGRKPEAEVAWSVVRALGPEDLPELQNKTPLALAAPRLKELRSAHHQLAQLLAKGETQETVCLMTGYSASYLSLLKSDPAFVELIKYYSIERGQIFIDLVEREKALGVATLEELQSRLEAEPEAWTKKELMELYDRLRPPGQAGKAAAGLGPLAPAPAIQINFVSAKPLAEVESQTIDLEVRRD